MPGKNDYKTLDPNSSLVDFLDTYGLAGKGYAEVDFLVVQAKTTATGDHNSGVFEDA